MTTDMDDDSRIPIIDAHHHLWDLDRVLSWLCDPEPIPFRYGDYSALKRSYLLADYRRDSASLNIVKTVHMEAEWNRTDPAGETKWLEPSMQRGFPNAIVGHAEPHRQDIADVLAAHAGSSLVRGIRHKPAASPTPAPRGAARGAPWTTPFGAAAMRFLGRSAFLRSETPWWHLDAAAELAAISRMR